MKRLINWFKSLGDTRAHTTTHIYYDEASVIPPELWDQFHEIMDESMNKWSVWFDKVNKEMSKGKKK